MAASAMPMLPVLQLCVCARGGGPIPREGIKQLVRRLPHHLPDTGFLFLGQARGHGIATGAPGGLGCAPATGRVPEIHTRGQGRMRRDALRPTTGQAAGWVD